MNGLLAKKKSRNRHSSGNNSFQSTSVRFQPETDSRGMFPDAQTFQDFKKRGSSVKWYISMLFNVHLSDTFASAYFFLACKRVLCPFNPFSLFSNPHDFGVRVSGLSLTVCDIKQKFFWSDSDLASTLKVDLDSAFLEG